MGTRPCPSANLNTLSSWDYAGTALSIDTNVPAFLQEPVFSDGYYNIVFDVGSISCWFQANWTSVTDGGTGPTNWAALFSAGHWTSNAADSAWALAISPAGTNLVMEAQSGGSNQVVFDVPIDYDAGDWHWVTITYSNTFASVYLEGALVTNVGAISNFPNDSDCTNYGMCFGSVSTAGDLQCLGQMQWFTTYDYVLPADVISNLYASTYGFISYFGGGFGPDFEGGGSYGGYVGSGGGTNLLAGFTPPGSGYTNCETWTNFWLRISASSDIITITISNTLPGLAYNLYETTRLPASPWTLLGTLTASGFTTTTNINAGTNKALFFVASLTTNDQAPVITNAPTNEYVGVGSNATFSVGATGLDLSYQWEFNGANIAGATTNSLTISGVESNNIGTYTVMVSNAICNTSASALLLWTPGTLKWKVFLGGGDDFGSGLSASPALGPDGTIYMANGNPGLTNTTMFFAINPSTGAIEWSNSIFNSSEFPTYSTNLGPEEFTSSAMVVSNRVYVGSDDGNVYCFNTTNHSLVWSCFLGTNASAFGSEALGSNGTIYAVTDEAMEGEGNPTGLWSINPTNGITNWFFQPQIIPNDEEAPNIDSSPAVSTDGRILFLAEPSRFFSVFPSGHLDWFLPMLSYTEPGSSPAIGADGTIYTGSQLSYFYALNPDGSLQWILDIETADPGLGMTVIPSSPCVGPDGVIYFGGVNTSDSSFEHVYALNPDGSLKWIFTNATGLIYSSPALSQDSTIYIGSADDNLYAITNGALDWSFQTGGAVISSPVIGNDGTVYVGSEDGFLYAFYAYSPPATNAPWGNFRKDPAHTGLQTPAAAQASDCGAPFVYNGSLEFNFSGQPSSFSFNAASSTNGGAWNVFASADLSNWTEVGSITLSDDGTGESNGIASFGTNFVSAATNQFFVLADGDCLSNSCRSRVIGFVSTVIAPGTNLIADQLCQVDDGLSETPPNTLNALFNSGASFPAWQTTQSPTQIFKWNGSNFDAGAFNYININSFVPASSGDITMLPGSSVIVSNGTGSPFTNSFVGLMREQQIFQIRAGTNYLSATQPVSGSITNVTGYIPQIGDVIKLWNTNSQAYVSYTNNSTGWVPSSPSVGVGEGYILITTDANAWTNTWRPGFPGCPGP